MLVLVIVIEIHYLFSITSTSTIYLSPYEQCGGIV